MSVNRADIASACIFMLVGTGVTLQALSYGLGNLRNIGSGAFPLLAGGAMVLLGLALLITSLSKTTESETISVQIRWGAAVYVLSALVAWAAITPRFGLVPGTIALVLLASFATGRPKALMVLGLIVVLCLMGILLFVKALGLPLPIFKF